MRGYSSLGLFILLFLITTLAIALVSGSVNHSLRSSTQQNRQIIVTTAPPPGQNNLQLQTFYVITLTPFPLAQNANACIGNPFNEEPDIFFASDPASGGTAVVGSQIRVWVDDGNGGSVAPGSVIDKNTGQIITPGDRTASDGKGSGYYLWEPALYLTPVSSPDQPGPFSGDVENGGTPHFPIIVKGEASLADTGNTTGFIKLPPIDPPVNVVAGKKGHGGHIAQFTWDVSSLGLTPGSGYYRVQIVVHDGDGDLAISCTTIQV